MSSNCITICFCCSNSKQHQQHHQQQPKKLYILIKVTSAMHCMLLVVINCQLFRETLSALMVLNAFWTGGTGKVTEFLKKIPNKKTKVSQIESIKSSFSFKYYFSRCIKDKIHSKTTKFSITLY